MAYNVGDLVEFEGDDAVVTASHKGGYDLAVDFEGRCRTMQLSVDESRLSSRGGSGE